MSLVLIAPSPQLGCKGKTIDNLPKTELRTTVVGNVVKHCAVTKGCQVSGFWLVSPVENFGSDWTNKCPVFRINVKKYICKLFAAKQHSDQLFMVQILCHDFDIN
jgi:hypothetical protein